MTKRKKSYIIIVAFYFNIVFKDFFMKRNLSEYLEAGKIANTHGVRGDVIIDSLCDSPKILAGLKTLYVKQQGEYKEMKIARSGVHNGRVLAKFVGIDTLDEVLPYKGKTVYAARKDISIDEDQVFIADLIGLPAYNTENGELIGKLSDVVNYGYNDIFEIDCGEGKKVLVPNLDQFVEKISLDDGVFIIPVEGLLE